MTEILNWICFFLWLQILPPCHFSKVFYLFKLSKHKELKIRFQRPVGAIFLTILGCLILIFLSKYKDCIPKYWFSKNEKLEIPLLSLNGRWPLVVQKQCFSTDQLRRLDGQFTMVLDNPHYPIRTPTVNDTRGRN